MRTFMTSGESSNQIETLCESPARQPASVAAEQQHRLLRLHGSIGASRRRTAGLRADVKRMLVLARLAKASGDADACRSHVAAARAIHRQAQKLDAFAALCAVRALRVDALRIEPAASPIM